MLEAKDHEETIDALIDMKTQVQTAIGMAKSGEWEDVANELDDIRSVIDKILDEHFESQSYMAPE